MRRQIRQQAWYPRVCMNGVLMSMRIDFLGIYQRSWEIGKRGCIAFQPLSKKNWFLFGRKQYGLRFLKMDGTNPGSFLDVYKIPMTGDMRPIREFCYSAQELMEGIWTPLKGRLEMKRKDEWTKRVKHTYTGIPWAFYEAMITCLRELSVWDGITYVLSKEERRQSHAIIFDHRLHDETFSQSFNSQSGPEEIVLNTPNAPMSPNGSARSRSRFQHSPQMVAYMANLRQQKLNEYVLTGSAANQDMSVRSSTREKLASTSTLKKSFSKLSSWKKLKLPSHIPQQQIQ